MGEKRYLPDDETPERPVDLGEETELLPYAVCVTLIKALGKQYRDITPITAVQMGDNFAVGTDYGVEDGEKGDWLIKKDGKFYRITANEFAETYRPFRKPKENKGEDKHPTNDNLSKAGGKL